MTEPRRSDHAISIYYPFPLAELTGYLKSEDFEKNGEVLLVLLDTAHCQVTLRLQAAAAHALATRLQREPDGSAITS